MDDSLLVEIANGFKNFSQDVGADVFTYLTFLLFNDIRKSSDIHELQNDPKFLLEVIGIVALENGVLILTHHHQSNLSLNIIELIHIVWLNELERKRLIVLQSSELEHLALTTLGHSAYDFVELTRILPFEDLLGVELLTFLGKTHYRCNVTIYAVQSAAQIKTRLLSKLVGFHIW